jgi:hypothetical protein
LAVVSILATLTTSTALGLGPEGHKVLPVQSHWSPRSATGRPVDTSVASIEIQGFSPSSSSEPAVAFELATSTTLTDPTPEEVLVMRTTEEPEDWTGGVASIAFGVGPLLPVSAPVEQEDCVRIAKTSPIRAEGAFDRNLIAQMTYSVFECITGLAGLDSVAPTAQRSWNGAEIWGFSSLAEQVAAEAIVVAYCESMGFSPHALTGSNGFGYAGLFQMGSREMARFGEPGSSRYDPVDNAIAAANYFTFQYRNRAGWGGWSPWAVVNTNFDDELNSQVRVPVLPRFASTDSEYRGRRGPELPAWAVDPWGWEVPHWRGTGCPFTGRSWPAASPLGDDS